MTPDTRSCSNKQNARLRGADPRARLALRIQGWNAGHDLVNAAVFLQATSSGFPGGVAGCDRLPFRGTPMAHMADAITTATLAVNDARLAAHRAAG